MDYGIGMFLAGLVSGAGIGWYSGILHQRIRQTDPKKSKRESNFYRHLLDKAGLSEDGDKGGLSSVKKSRDLTDNTGITAHGCNVLCVAENSRLGKLATSRRLNSSEAWLF